MDDIISELLEMADEDDEGNPNTPPTAN